MMMLVLENKSSKEKQIDLRIESQGYLSMNDFEYSCVLGSNEGRFLFPMAVDKNNIQGDEASLKIKFHIKTKDI